MRRTLLRVHAAGRDGLVNNDRWLFRRAANAAGRTQAGLGGLLYVSRVPFATCLASANPPGNRRSARAVRGGLYGELCGLRRTSRPDSLADVVAASPAERGAAAGGGDRERRGSFALDQGRAIHVLPRPVFSAYSGPSLSRLWPR